MRQQQQQQQKIEHNQINQIYTLFFHNTSIYMNICNIE